MRGREDEGHNDNNVEEEKEELYVPLLVHGTMHNSFQCEGQRNIMLLA